MYLLEVLSLGGDPTLSSNIFTILHLQVFQ